MSHITGTIQTVSPALGIGPDSGAAPSSPNVWMVEFASTPAPMGTKLVMLHFQNVSLPAANRLEVDLGYGTDVFTAADGTDLWTRPANVYVLPGGKVPIRYITSGSGTGGAQLDRYGRGERHAGEQDPTALSNCDPFLGQPNYTEPIYDPFWFCSPPPSWENIACVPSGDVRRTVARSVGMVMHADADHLSTCSVTLVGPDLVLTAGHCLAQPAEHVRSSSVTFEYQTNCDGSRPASYAAGFHKVRRVVAHRNDGGGDYCLLELVTPPEGLGIPPLQMRHDLAALGEQAFGVHHPNGAVKKLSIPHPGFATVTGSTANSVNVPKPFHVSGGSSGSALFDAAGRVLGTLSNGNPCGRGGGTPTSLSYWPTATMLQQIATPAGPAVTRDVMLVLDRSGSMSLPGDSGQPKLDEARDAASLFVQLVRADTGNRVGLVSFSTTASAPPDQAISSVTAASKTALIGPPPYSGGVLGGLVAGGMTSIGGGLEAARLQFPAPGAAPRAVLLLTDGLQNTPPLVAAVEAALGDIDVEAIGYGTPASLDGALLSALAAAHDGRYVRADSRLRLEKFFAQAFGNIFQAGLLMDPEAVLPADQQAAEPVPFSVCGEEAVTVVVGWDREDADLLIRVETPSGTTVAGGDESAGRTWTFTRIELPHGGERDGTWQVQVFRPGGGELSPPAPELRYFINVIPAGGPRLFRVGNGARYYTGDPINPLVLLQDGQGNTPHDAQMTLTVERPDTALGNVLAEARLRAPVTVDADTVPARQATLLALEAERGAPVTGWTQETFDLSADPVATGGRFEASGVFGSPRTELLTVDGDYMLHYRATYGEDCAGTRELVASVHVHTGIDPGHTEVSTTVTPRQPTGTLTVRPKDRYGNHLGPGRLDGFTISPAAGTTVTGPVSDEGDGSYSVPISWDAGSGEGPGVIVEQPGRGPVVVQPPTPGGHRDRCRWCKRLFWLLLGKVLLLLAIVATWRWNRRPHAWKWKRKRKRRS